MTAANTNGINAQDAQRWMGEALRVYADLEAQKIENMNRCRDIRSRLSDIYDAAKYAGLPVRALKLSVKKVLFEKKIEGLQEGIEDLTPEDEDDAASYEMLQEALGGFADTPLGAATLDQAADRRGKAAARKSKKAAPEAADHAAVDQQAADDAQVQQNVERLKGITPIPEREPFEDDAVAAKDSRRARRAAKLDDLTQH